jgi:flagellar M-ring protein FliF
MSSFADFAEQLKGILRSMSAGKLISLGVLLIGTVAGMIALISWSGQPEFVPLYTHLAAEDAGEVVARLREQKIAYRLSHDGSTVQIPRQRLYEVRLDLAAQGLPRGGSMGFELFDNTKLGMTEFVQNINYQRALEGELSRTVNGLAEVESSRIHIVMSDRSLFIEEERPATASVILKLKAGRWLNEKQVQGIVHLVASSVPRLGPDKVTVVDNNGNLLAGVNDTPTPSKISNDQLEFQQRKEKLLEQRVATMLEKVLGKDKAIVRVACELDFVQHEKTQETYFPENQVVRSEQLSSERSAQPETIPAGVPGLAANIGNRTPAETRITKPGDFEKKDNTRNYEIGKMTSHQILPTGKLIRLSAAVIVDGNYKTRTVGKGNKKEVKTEYEARTPEEMQSLENIVKRAINFDESRGDRVEVANIPFNTDKLIETQEPSGGERWYTLLKTYGSIFKYLAAAVFVFFTFIYIIKPLIIWLTETAWEDVELLEHLPRSLDELENQYAHQDKDSAMVSQAAQLMASKQEDSTRLMQQWLKEN